MSMFDPFVLPDSPVAPWPPRHPAFRPLVRVALNIALASLTAFAVCGSAACALRIVLSH
jgi:hypothetical protein